MVSISVMKSELTVGKPIKSQLHVQRKTNNSPEGGTARLSRRVFFIYKTIVKQVINMSEC